VDGLSLVVSYPLATVNGGNARGLGLGVSVAAVTSSRFTVVYQDSYGQPTISDGAVFGTSTVIGRYVCVAYLSFAKETRRVVSLVVLCLAESSSFTVTRTQQEASQFRRR
jgi:hypothetical protein